jgi:hypothetical protein
LREEHRLRVFENTVLRRIFGPKSKTGCGGNCIMMNFIACILYLILLRGMRWAAHVAHLGEGRGVYRVLVGKP